MSRAREVIGWVLLISQVVGTPLIVPDWSLAKLAEPVTMASIALVVTTLFIIGLRARGIRGSARERATLAMFLGGMPIVYLASWFIAPQPGWLGVELLGLAVYGGLALLGAFRSPWFLAGGIAAHGILWDSWHVHRATFVPDWYAIGCLLVDVSLGLYVALEIPRLARHRDGVMAKAA